MHLHPGKKVWLTYSGNQYRAIVLRIKDSGLCRPVVVVRVCEQDAEFTVGVDALSERNEE